MAEPWHRSPHIRAHTPSQLATTTAQIVDRAIDFLGGGVLYRVLNEKGVGLRTAPEVDAKSDRPPLDGGDLFLVSEKQVTEDGIVWAR